MLIDIIAGARPNFIKISPIINALINREDANKKLEHRLVHTGQHYDKNMSETFFEQLGIPLPDVNLEVGSGTQAVQTARIMEKYEEVLLKKSCQMTIVVGDVNSTMACSIVAKKMNIKVAHVEAGIRSYDLTMPEEINRMVTDSITDHFFTTSSTANENLKKSGIHEDRIHFVGNTMIDTLLANINKLQQPGFWSEIGLNKGKYYVITLHRPANVDEGRNLKGVIEKIIDHSQTNDLVFPIHPRTAKIFGELGINHERLHLIDPLPYLEFNYLVQQSKAVITDSGGITEETTVMGIPCLTLRDNTERPETCEIGTNELVGTNPDKIGPALDKLNSGNWKKGKIPELWDGKTAERIVDILYRIL